MRDEEMERVGALRGEWLLCIIHQHEPSEQDAATYTIVGDMALDLFPADCLPQLAYELAALYPACCAAKRGGGLVAVPVPLPGTRARCLGGGGGGGGTRGGVGGVEVLEEGGRGEVGLGEEGECGVGEVALEEVEVHEDVDLHAAQLHGLPGGGPGGGGRQRVAPRRLRRERREHRHVSGGGDEMKRERKREICGMRWCN